MNGKKLIAALTKELGGITQNELAKILEKEPEQVDAWKYKEVSPLTVARIVRKLNSQIVRGDSLVPVWAPVRMCWFLAGLKLQRFRTRDPQSFVAWIT